MFLYFVHFSFIKNPTQLEMSSMYYKVDRKPQEPIKQWGFQKVNRVELRDIVARVQKNTYLTESYRGEINQCVPSPPRRPTSTCPKLPRSDEKEFRQQKPIPKRWLNRLVRRLQKPTVSTAVAAGKYVCPESSSNQSGKMRPQSAPEERQRIVHRIQRPTTASFAKRSGRGVCQFCDDDKFAKCKVHAKVFFADYGLGTRYVQTEELNSIIQRVRTPTKSSSKGRDKCEKVREPPHINRNRIPLVSGLARTRHVEDIVTRLYTPTQSIGICKYSPPATPITVYSSKYGR